MSTGVPQSQQPREFLFRGNAVAASGFLTRMDGQRVPLDPNTATVHGESTLPMAGGVSRSQIKAPALPFPNFIRYGVCETFVMGGPSGDSMVTTLRASVSGVQITTSPSDDDLLPDVQSMSFTAERLSIAVRSTHPQVGQPSFELLGEPETAGMSLAIMRHSLPASRIPIRLQFDQSLLALPTLEDLDREFLGNRAFFDEHINCFRGGQALVFGKSRVPRSAQGYVSTSIVSQIHIDGQVIQGNVLQRPGFGRIAFGVMITDEISRRISLVRVRFGSNPGGDSCLTSVETNGIWQ